MPTVQAVLELGSVNSKKQKRATDRYLVRHADADELGKIVYQLSKEGRVCHTQTLNPNQAR